MLIITFAAAAAVLVGLGAAVPTPKYASTNALGPRNLEYVPATNADEMVKRAKVEPVMTADEVVKTADEMVKRAKV